MQTSWEDSSAWYDKTVGEKGHYYHQQVILPGLLKLLNLNAQSRLLDLACGQGVLARALPKEVAYLGVDAAPSLIREAQKKSKHSFMVADVCKPFQAGKFTHATIILALQNMADPSAAIKNAAAHLESGGKLVLVLNHPCFRIPRQSSWGIDEQKKMQYRRIDRYLSPLNIPIQTHPGKQAMVETTSFHHPLSAFIKWLNEAGFDTELLEEWVSDKKSTGSNARMENRSRQEFPLFMAIRSKKN